MWKAHTLSRSVICASLISALLVGCSQEAVHQPDPTPPASMVALMLTPDDVPGGDNLVAQNNIVETTGCLQADYLLSIALSHTPETDATTVVIDAGDVEVTQTLVLDLIESEPNQRFHSIASVISSCDGRTLEAPYWAMPSSPPTRSESFTLTTATNGNQPATPTPLDLLDTAIQRADVTIDHAALTVPYPEEPFYEPTTSQPSTEPTTTDQP